MRFRRSRALALGAALLLTGVAWADEWYDAYARGLEALKQGKAERAVELFERAIRMGPEPGIAVFTYGTNRLDEYFPYLRLAEAQLLGGNLAAAREALKLSEARGKEPAAERARIASLVEAAVEKARIAAAAPPTLGAAAPVVVPSALPTPAGPATGPAASSPPATAPPQRIEPRGGASRAAAVVTTAPTATMSPVASPTPTPAPSVESAPTGRAALEPAASSRASPLAVALGVLLLGVGAWAWRARAGAGSAGAEATPVGELETRAITRLGGLPGAVGESFGPYRLLEPLGKGGMASVFKAERHGELCALKRPLAAFLEEPEFLERFLREAEIGRTLHHPNIVRIFERGDVDGIPYFTMELVKGQTLQALIRERGALGPDEAARVIAQVAEALDYAHLKGVVHRDLKPSNIMILEGGIAKVMDYGIARARRFEGQTLAGTFLGTPEYAAPETAQGKPTDARSDLYSLGVVFYEMVTGAKPFVGDTPFVTLQKHCTEPPPPPSTIVPGTPRPIEAIVLRLLSKDPVDRYPGAEELLIDLRDYVNRAG